MRAEAFDDLTRRYGDGRLSRRGLLKALFFGAISAGFGWLGLRSANAYAPAPAPQANEFKGYLPFVQSACSEASRCGARKYCDEKQGCLCVKTTEGDIRCGKLPGCDSKLCTSSADCASLGEGAFCDTPLSGCCTSPPNTLSRCLVACPPCPAERLCNGNCCQPGQVCRSGTCATPELCSSDPITDASLAAARAAYAAGTADIQLSPNGCQRYTCTTSGAQQVETMTLGGFPVLKAYKVGDNSLTYYYDNDQDGFNERDATFNYASGTTRMLNRIFNRYDPLTQRRIARRYENRRDDTTVDVTVEEWDTTGAQILREQYVDSLLDTFPDASPTSVVLSGIAQAAAPQAAGPCSADDAATFEERMGVALKQGEACLKKYKHPQATRLGLFRLGGSVTIVCDTSLNAVAQATSGEFPKGPIVITVNPDLMKVPTKGVLPGESIRDFQARVLFHELSHYMVGEHAPRTEYFSQFDPTRACDQLCFDPNANQCHCQTCLGTKECADECKALPACKSSIQNCGTRCCVGPCDGQSCCPSERICNKKQDETAICCGANEVCINTAGGGSACCPKGQVCKAPSASAGEEGKEICCQPNEQCGQDPSGNPKCITPQIYCPACPPINRPVQCFPASQAGLCQQSCSGNLNCPNSCHYATGGQCP